jgi:hypothetical protein
MMRRDYCGCFPAKRKVEDGGVRCPHDDGLGYCPGMRVLRESNTGVSAVVLALCMLAGSTVYRRSSPVTTDPCALAQKWYRGDDHYWDYIELRSDMTGQWRQGGLAGGPQRHIDFNWRQTASTFTAIYDSMEHTVAFTLTSNSDGVCFLSFPVHPFVADRPIELKLSNVR